MLTSLTVSRGLRVVDVDVNKSAVIDISGEATDGGHRNADGIGAHGKLPGARDRIALPLPLGSQKGFQCRELRFPTAREKNKNCGRQLEKKKSGHVSGS